MIFVTSFPVIQQKKKMINVYNKASKRKCQQLFNNAKMVTLSSIKEMQEFPILFLQHFCMFDNFHNKKHVIFNQSLTHPKCVLGRGAV